MATPKYDDALLLETFKVWKQCGQSPMRASKLLGISRMSVTRRVRAAKQRGLDDETTTATGNGGNAAPRQRGAAQSLQSFRETYDKDYIIPRRIKDGLRTLLDDEGNPGWAYEVQFAKHCGVSPQDLGNYRDSFASHVVVLSRDGRRAWAATPEVATTLRGMIK